MQENRADERGTVMEHKDMYLKIMNAYLQVMKRIDGSGEVKCMARASLVRTNPGLALFG